MLPARARVTRGKQRARCFRAIQKVYASFYNENAFLERLRPGRRREPGGTAVLVHVSTPDEIELANGVATVWEESSSLGESQIQAVLVTQARAVSVTNPDSNAKPEVVELTEFGPSLKEPSSLVPLGSYVLNWPAEDEALGQLLFRVYRAYGPPEGLCQPNNWPVLDFEYKKVEPGNLLLSKSAHYLPADRTLPPPRATCLTNPRPIGFIRARVRT